MTNPFLGTDLAIKGAEWKSHPAQMVEDIWGGPGGALEPLDPWAIDALELFPSQKPEHLRIALQGPTGNAKTAVMAWCALNFMAFYGDALNHPCADALSITRDKLMTRFVKEIAKWRGMPTPGVSGTPFFARIFEMTSEKMFAREHKDTWFLEFTSYPKEADEITLGRTLAGLHGKYVAHFVDESAAIPVAVMNSGEQAQSGNPAFFKFMQSFNPLTMDGMGYAAVKKFREMWHVVRVTGDPDDPKRSSRVPMQWARDQIATRGRDDPWVKVYILSEFPDKPFNALLSPDEVDIAMKRAPRADEFEAFAKVLGLDVARGGLARSSLASRQGPMVWPFQTWPSTVMGAEGAGHVAERWRDWKANALFNDGTGGFAGSWHDHLIALGFTPIAVGFAGEPTNRRFFNKRSEMWWNMAEGIKTSWALPNDPRLAAQLLAMTYTFKGDRLIMEDKAQVEARAGITLDEADSLALTTAYPVMPPAAEPSTPWGRAQWNEPQVARQETVAQIFGLGR